MNKQQLLSTHDTNSRISGGQGDLCWRKTEVDYSDVSTFCSPDQYSIAAILDRVTSRLPTKTHLTQLKLPANTPLFDVFRQRGHSSFKKSNNLSNSIYE